MLHPQTKYYLDEGHVIFWNNILELRDCTSTLAEYDIILSEKNGYNVYTFWLVV